jgi:hypothetical protein
MKHIFSWKGLVSYMLFMAAPVLTASAQTPSGICGTQPLCYETADFAATVANFRTSATPQGYKIIDTTVRFQNKTNQPLVLGYVNSSGMATDERGNRSIVWGPNGYRGIGLVAGANFDPKFVVRPGSYADAQFELVLQGWPKVIGFTYDLSLTVAEINSFQGNQHTLGGEFPLHFQGLANGASGAAPGVANGLVPGLPATAAAGPCGLAATQGAAGKASSTVSNAASTLSSLGSIFGKKKAAQNANQVASAAAGCDPRVNAAASTAGTFAGAVADNGSPQVQPAALTNVAQQQMPMGAAADSSAALNTANAYQTSTPATTPSAIAADAYTKTKQAQQQRRGRQQQRVNSQQTTQEPQQIATAAAPNLPPPQGAPASSEPWTPPADVPKGPVGPMNPAKMPDIIGIHLGMDPKEAVAVTRAHYPKNTLTPYQNDLATFPVPVFQGAYINPANNFQDDFNFQSTLPPEKQAIWKVRRITKGMHINRETLLAALREKYGKESVATGNDPRTPISSDREITQLLWLFDEQGRHVPLPFSNAMVAMDCRNGLPDGPGGAYLVTEVRGGTFQSNGWCASSYVAVHVTIGSIEPIIESITTDMTDLPLALRTAHSTTAWYRVQAEKARKQDLEKSKQAKPVF